MYLLELYHSISLQLLDMFSLCVEKTSYLDRSQNWHAMTQHAYGM